MDDEDEDADKEESGNLDNNDDADPDADDICTNDGHAPIFADAHRCA